MKTELTYTLIDGIYYPNLSLPEQTDYPIGKYGRMRLDFLRKHRKGTHTTLLISGKLNQHLAEIHAEATECVRKLTDAFAAANGITEQVKAVDALHWAQEMNNCKARAEEIVMQEVIYR